MRITGPLLPHKDGLWAELRRQGYSPLSGRNLLRAAAHLSRWLVNVDIEVGALTDERVAAFGAHRRRLGYERHYSTRGLRPIISYLRELGVVPPAEPAACTTAIDRFLREYSEYLARERGAAARTILHYSEAARRFAVTIRRLEWGALTPAEIIKFSLRESRRSSVLSCKRTLTGLRSVLRFLHLRGETLRDLSAHVPRVGGWRLASVPKALERQEVERLFSVCDLRTSRGRRDSAILGLLVRLGLRASEVADLQLDHVDWRGGELIVGGKSRHRVPLPIPRDVGEKLSAYLRRGRPRTLRRHLFVHERAPHDQLTGPAVTSIVTRIMRRAGVRAGGAHVLRHTAATEMLRGGASLAEIGHVLRHRNSNTTAIYAKVDLGALRPLALPWPGEGS